MSPTPRPEETPVAPQPVREPVAVIDIGATSIRMAIAELCDQGEVRMLEVLSQAVNLGRDTFTRGSIKRGTIEACVGVLRGYRKILETYDIGGKQIRVVATSAVREADNRLVFLDRIYSATGLQVEPIDEAEVIRLTYLAVQADLQQRPDLEGADRIVLEVGGGNTELLMIREGEVAFSHSYPLGSLRLREVLESFRTPAEQLQSVIQTRIDRMVSQVLQQMPAGDRPELIALGGDMRFAAAQLRHDWDGLALVSLSLDELAALKDKLLVAGVDELVSQYQLDFEGAENVGLALAVYVQLARAMALDRVLVSSFNLRDGLLRQMAARDSWSDAFAQQIVRAALELGRKYQFDETHARHTAYLCSVLFEALRSEHAFRRQDGLLLQIAALLHEIGQFVNPTDYHKHSSYLIASSELFGLNQDDLELVGLVARYHRKTPPKPKHRGYSRLDRDQRIAVSKLAAILRIAKALDSSRSQRVCDIHCEQDGDTLVIQVSGLQDLSLEQMSLRQKGVLFGDVFGLRVELQRADREDV